MSLGGEGGKDEDWARNGRTSTVTLLRLHPNHQSYHRYLPPRRVGPATSGTTNSHDVTGGVYKARERIHRGMLIHDY